MAAPIPAPRKIYQRRSIITSLPLYYEGFVWIKRDKKKECKYWAELRGTTIFLYSDKKQEKYTDTIELQSLVSLADRYPLQKQWAEVVLTLPNEEVYLKTENAEDAEEWKGFILTVVELSVPNCLALLPGQVIRLKEVLEKETTRKATQTSIQHLPPPSLDLNCETYEDVGRMPLCFHKVTRQEAADMLMKMSSCGNLILRPGADSKNFAVTIREPTDMSQVKHYRVLDSDRGYTIELEKPVTLKSLDEVVEHFIKETRGKLRPFVTNLYEPLDKTLKGTGGQMTTAQANIRTQFSPPLESTHLPLQRKQENVYIND
ncbi:signal-transducing adaptor protein 1 isoform 2-T2 [Discoglossus pictus]